MTCRLRKQYAPFTRSSLHRLSAELASCSGPLATRASLWPIFAGCIASDLSQMSMLKDAEVIIYSAPSCVDIRHKLATPSIASYSGRWDRTARGVARLNSSRRAPFAAANALGVVVSENADAHPAREPLGLVADIAAVGFRPNA